MRPFYFILGLFLTLTSCRESEVTPHELLAVPQPANFPEKAYLLDNNPVSREGFELGKTLFYDPILSRDGAVSCGSCHQPYIAFADPVHTLSVGVDNRTGIRNAPPLFNLAFQKFFFWDGSVNHLDFVALQAITNEVELDESVAKIVSKLNASAKYQTLFASTFEQDSISSQQLLHALSQFLVMLVSANSPYDMYVRNEGVQLEETALAGLTVFQQKCADCHATDLFTDQQFHNNGLDAEFSSDPGRGDITELAEDVGKFRTPTLRNITLTAPYMHDGRFETLDQVLEHYSSGVQPSSSLDTLLLQENRPGISLSAEEKAQIIAFLKTLTDQDFVRDNRFFDPN